MLLEEFLAITREWETVFPQHRTYVRAVAHALGFLCCLGRKTLSRVLWALRLDQVDWSASYRLFSRSRWETRGLFWPIVRRGVRWCSSTHIVVAADDTRLRKTGKKIATAHWQRDPLSPPFRVNLMFGLRFLQLSVVIPHHHGEDLSARAVPVCFEEVPVVKKPGKRATDEERRQYHQRTKRRPLCQKLIELAGGLRQDLDRAGAWAKTLLMVVDGGFCNGTCFSAQTDRVHWLGRARKDACLRFPEPAGSRRTYSAQRFTPESVRLDETIPWKTAQVFHGGAWRSVRYKEVCPVLWQHATRRRRLRLVIVAPTPYRLTRRGKVYYRQPAYLLTTDLEADVTLLMQAYFDRWQIEVNHRDEKDTLGIGQAQVRSPLSVTRQPALAVAAYSALLLASIQAFGPARTAVYMPLPKWRRNATRPSCLDLIQLLRKELQEAQTLNQSPSCPIHIANIALVANA